jgi:hypothetical protein
MKRIAHVIASLAFSVLVQGQDTTWFRNSGLPHEKVFGSAFMGINQNIFGYYYAQFWMGNPSMRLAEYDRAGNLLQFGSMPIGYWDFRAYDWLYLGDGSFLASGDGASPRSQNAKWGRFIVLHDSAGNLIMERTLAQANISSFFKAADTSFFAIENANTTYLTHFNTKGDTLWQMPYSQMLGISILDSNYAYELQHMECVVGEAVVWLKHKLIEEQLIFHFDPNTGNVYKRDTLNIAGFVKGNRINEKGWNGYVVVNSDSINSQKISYFNTSFTPFWEIKHSANLGVDVIFSFLNNDSNLVFSAWYSSKFKSYNSHTYSRIYTVDINGIERFSAQYFDTLRAYRFSPKYQFEDGGYLLNIQSYHHIAESFGYGLARTKPDGSVIDTAQDRGWNGTGPFKDVSLFDPFADSVHIGVTSVELSDFIRIYPNPSSSILNIAISSTQTANYTLQNLKGQTLIEDSFENKTQLDVSRLPNGIYFLQILGYGILETRKIVVHH